MTKYKNREAMVAEIRLLRLKLEIAEKKNKALQNTSRGDVEHLQEEVNFYKEKFLQEAHHNSLLKERLEDSTSRAIPRAVVLMLEETIKELEDIIVDQQDALQILLTQRNCLSIELETYKHAALLWSMVDSPILREQAQKLLDKKQEESQEIEY